MILQPNQRTKLDTADDNLFYDYPRFVTHVDDGFIQRLTEVYRDRLTAKMNILDMMSSWVSHLPDDVEFASVTGHGMNQEELARNPRLDRYVVQNLNQEPTLPFADQQFDAVLNAVSVQYLQHPEKIFAEIQRVLKPGGIAIISFSNRMFYQKAIQAWRDGTERQRVVLVQQYFRAVGGFSPPEVIAHQSSASAILQLLGLGGGDPFYAVLAQRLGGCAEK